MVQVKMVLPLIVLSHHFPNFIGYLDGFFFSWKTNNTDFLLCVSSQKAMGLWKEGCLGYQECVTAVDCQRWAVLLVLLRAGCCLRGEESLLWPGLNLGRGERSIFHPLVVKAKSKSDAGLGCHCQSVSMEESVHSNLELSKLQRVTSKQTRVWVRVVYGLLPLFTFVFSFCYQGIFLFSPVEH